jgi:Ser/Thr protein kinase RdoA (MazF antagonist)
MAAELGRLVAFIHASIPLTSFQPHAPPSPRDEVLPDSWLAFLRFMRAQRVSCVERHRQWNSLPTHLLSQLDDYLPRCDDMASFLWTDASPATEAVWLHGDLTATNLIMRRGNDGSWQVGGLIDFGDAKVGHRLYDLVVLHALVFRCDKALLRDFLSTYGHHRPSPAFARTAMCLTLLHQHDVIGAVARCVPLSPVTDLHQLAALLWLE